MLIKIFVALYILWSALHKLSDIRSSKLRCQEDEDNVWNYVKDDSGAYEELVSTCLI